MARTVTLQREPSVKDGTFGSWISDSGFICPTMELPDLGNQPNVSCIPKGSYSVKWAWSPHHNCNLYHIQNVVGRSNVEIHSANVTLQLLGCIAPGLSVTIFSKGTVLNKVPPFLILEADRAGLASSHDALSHLEKDLRDDNGNQVEFTLNII